MKYLLFTALSLSLAAGPAALAQNYQPQGQIPQHAAPQHGPQQYQPEQHQAQINHEPPHPAPAPARHQWHEGDRFTGSQNVVSNWSHYHLHQPPSGYHWVQDGSQFVLVAVATGIISSVILSAQ